MRKSNTIRTLTLGFLLVMRVITIRAMRSKVIVDHGDERAAPVSIKSIKSRNSISISLDFPRSALNKSSIQGAPSAKSSFTSLRDMYRRSSLLRE